MMKRMKNLLQLVFPFRARVSDLEIELRNLSKQVDALSKPKVVLYNRDPYKQTGCSQLLNLNEPSASDKLNFTLDVIENENCLDDLVFYIETTEGVFYRHLEDAAYRRVCKDGENIQIKASWLPVKAGKDFTILDSAIAYRDVVFGRANKLHGMKMQQGETIKISFTFKCG